MCYRSVLALGDLTKHFKPDETGVCVLEEPEHLNWFHHGEQWCQKWALVIGVIHTNYWSYTRAHETGGLMAAALTQQINRWMCGGYCHKSIKLSDALPPLPRSVTQNTHGVRDEYLAQGDEVGAALRARDSEDAASQNLRGTTGLNGAGAQSMSWVESTTAGSAFGSEAPSTPPPFTKGMYFIGKMLWAKGHKELLELLSYLASPHDTGSRHGEMGSAGFSASAFGTWLEETAGGRSMAGWERLGEAVAAAIGSPGLGPIKMPIKSPRGSPRGSTGGPLPDVDVYGSGGDKHSIEAAAARLAGKVTVRFHPAVDHASPELRPYKIFVNPCRTDVLCTTTAEALAAGKFAIIEDNPSNSFFKRLPNCLTYRTPAEFVAQVQFALSMDPQPLDAAQRYLLSWEAATDRLVDAMLTPVPGEEGPNPGDKAFAAFHQSLFRGRFGDWSRGILGAGPIAQQYQIMKAQSESTEAPEVVQASVEAPDGGRTTHTKPLRGRAATSKVI